jgi:hypothetical protein
MWQILIVLVYKSKKVKNKHFIKLQWLSKFWAKSIIRVKERRQGQACTFQVSSLENFQRVKLECCALSISTLAQCLSVYLIILL